MLNIKKVPVNSSNIEAIGFEANPLTSPTVGTLRVWFKDNRSYDYEKVPPQEFEKLKQAQSTGSYFASNIKGKYSYTRVDK